ncbi:25S rRNA (adenine(645)-N(1))-methyltransferase [Aspergillus awamori]|uniref:Ribosomal RNA-processing protein 8 n=2 Tax=Aspergillus TaxID=5052 RepID=A0A3F3PZK3_9EURO|nr:methyltransferase-domain-containing protein [Aspergillus welwitschiae]RDH31806.1 methyltransferase-domain-containing protein [Aspergillus welwitschiae]GCB18710.1 25S rRNA (adenine(645)-N(1))-methyltransferase [Aspergillus awamori]GKZ63029.1 25S rRNA (adenine645-N1)-methyltransferase [Aspergillus niger]
MFAVPGWSLETSALKQQQAESSQKQSSSKSSTGANSTPIISRDKKRKREDHVTKGNVDEMYRRHIEGQKSTPKGQKQNANNNGVKADRKSKKGGDGQGKQNQVTKNQPKDEKTEATGEEGKPANKKQKKNKNKNKQQEGQQEVSTETPAAETLPVAPPKTEAILTPLQQAMRQKLISSRFRHLNETLYTTPSAKAFELFSANPELFDEYHAGFSRQVKESWPSNPVDGYIRAFRGRGAVRGPPKKGKPDNKRNSALALPRRPNGLCTIADLGCGDAQLARALLPSAQKLNLKLLSYDLHAPEGSPITKADISNLPLADGSVDVTVFCLSLMGTNWVSFVEEAWRVLRSDGKGECWVSEVKSRFGKVHRKKAQIGAKKPLSKSEKKKLKKKAGDDEGSDVDDADIYAEDARPADNDDETDISAFVEVFRTRGFLLKPESVDKSNKMFVKMEFVKAGGAPTKGKYASTAGAAAGPGKKRFIDRSALADKGMTAEEEAAVLKPCVYKIR